MPDVGVNTRQGGAKILDEDDLRRLKTKENLRGELIRPEGTRYNEARQVYNAMHDRRRALNRSRRRSSA